MLLFETTDSADSSDPSFWSHESSLVEILLYNRKHSTYCSNYVKAASELERIPLGGTFFSHGCHDRAHMLTIIFKINLNGSR